MNDRCDVLIVDDHQLFRSGLCMLLSSRHHVVGQAGSGVQMLEFLSSERLPDVVLLDIAMPDMNGIEAAEKALSLYPNLPIITLSMYGDEEYYFKMVSLGVKGFLLKSSDIGEVFEAISAVTEGGSYFSQELLTNLVSSLHATAPMDAALSERELEIVLLVCKGLTASEIADDLFISKRTVDKHRANILEKTSCKNTANLVVYAIKNQLVRI